MTDINKIRDTVNEAITEADQRKDYDRVDKLEDILRKIKAWEAIGCPEPPPFLVDMHALGLLGNFQPITPELVVFTPAEVIGPEQEELNNDLATTPISAVLPPAEETEPEHEEPGEDLAIPTEQLVPPTDEPTIEGQGESGDDTQTTIEQAVLPPADPDARLEMPEEPLSEDAIKRLYERLSARYLQAADEEAPETDQLRAVRKAVKAWMDGGPSGTIPFRDALDAWNLLEEPVPPVAVVSPQPDDSMTVPHANAEIIPVIDTEPDITGTVTNENEISDAAQERTNIISEPESGSSARIFDGGTEQAEVKPEEPLANDSDEVLVDDFHAAQAMFAAGQVYAAYEKLNQLYSVASGGLVAAIQSEREAVGTRLQELTDERAETVRDYARKAPNDLKGLRKKWEAVRDFNPQGVEAIQAIEALDMQLHEKEVQDAVDDIRRRVDTAEARKDLLAFSKIYGNLEQLLDQAGGSDDAQMRVQGAENYWRAARGRVRGALGVASTAAVQGDFKKAYADAIMFASNNTITMVPDVSGYFGDGTREYTKEEFLEKVAALYTSQLRQKAAERLETAAQERDQAPNRARRHVEEALGWLNDPNFREMESRELAPERDRLQRFLDDLQELLSEFIRAEASVKQGDDADNPTDRLRCFRDAQRIYPKYPEIESRISLAREDIANFLATQVETICAEAAQLAGKEQYEEAISSLTKVRTNVSQEFPTLEEGTRLRTAFDQAQKDIQQYTTSLRDYGDMLALLDEAKKALEDYRKTQDNRLVNQARTLYQQLTNKPYARRHPKVEAFYADLTSQQDDNANWDDGQQRYFDHEWKSAYESLRKVGDKSMHFASASVMASRAQAAMRTEFGKAAEDRQDWKKALTEYRGAVSIIEGDPTRGTQPVPTDAECEEMYQQAKEGIERLHPIEERDKQKKALLDVSRRELETAMTIDKARGSLDQRVEPIKQFAIAANPLKESLQQPSTLAGEMQGLLSEIKIAWRETYIKTVKEVLALTVPDETLVQKACQLVQELKTEGLIYAREDQLPVLRLLCLQKEQEYRRLVPQIGSVGEERIILSGSGIDWAAVESNRQDLLKTADEIRRLVQQSKDAGEWEEAAAKVKAARDELKTVSRRRIHQEVSRRLVGPNPPDAHNARVARPTTTVDTVRDALVYLQQQLEVTPWLSTDTSLIAKLIKLYWQAGDWEGAQQAVSHFFGSSEIPDSDIYQKTWRESTKAAEAYAESEPDKGDAYFDELLRDRTFSFESLVEEIRKELRDELVKRLIHEAQEAQRRGDDESLVLAADKYAQASKIEPNNRVVEVGLRDIGAQLARGLANRCEQARSFRIDRHKLDDSIRKAEAMLKTLQSIESVTRLLDLDQDLIDTIKQTIEEFAPRLARWQRFSGYCATYANTVKDQLSAPEPLQVDSVTGEVLGGWMVDEIDAQVEKLEREARGDNDLIKMATDRRDQAYSLRASMVVLNQQVNDLMEAVKMEDFRKVIESAGNLEQTWQAECTREPRWDGLSDLIHKDFSPWFTRGATDLRTHRSIAEKQQKNYEAWAAWADEVAQASEQVETGARNIGKPLEGLKEMLSLTEIIDVCRSVISAAKAFEERLARAPKDMPLSAKAQQQKDRIREGLKDDLADCTGRAEKLCEEAREQLIHLEPELVKLRRTLDAVRSLARKRKDGQVPQVSLEPAVRQFKECMKLDPCHAELIKARQYLTGLGAVIQY